MRRAELGENGAGSSLWDVSRDCPRLTIEPCNPKIDRTRGWMCPEIPETAKKQALRRLRPACASVAGGP